MTKIKFRKLATGILAMFLLLAGVLYLNFRKKSYDNKIESEQSTTKSADSVLIEKLSNMDTITSLQDPIDTTRQIHPK